jgi:hypothetical protein
VTVCDRAGVSVFSYRACPSRASGVPVTVLPYRVGHNVVTATVRRRRAAKPFQPPRRRLVEHYAPFPAPFYHAHAVAA